MLGKSYLINNRKRVRKCYIGYVSQLSVSIFPIFMFVFFCFSNVAKELSEAIITMVTNAGSVLQKRQGAPTPTSAIVGAPKGGLGPSLQGLPNPATPPSVSKVC